MATYLKRDTQGPCPDGWHIPTKADWEKVINAGITLGAWQEGGGMGSMLKIPNAGIRSSYDASVLSSGTSADLTTATSDVPNKKTCWSLSANYSRVEQTSYRTTGLSLRPFKNIYLVPTSSWTTIYQGTGNAGIFHNASEGAISISSDGTTWYTISDKNLGATKVYNEGDTLSEANCGKFYQWGNNYGFAWSGSVSTTTAQANVFSYGPGNYYSSDKFFITISWDRDTDWQVSYNSNLWGGSTNLRPEPVYSSTTITYKDNLGTTINTITSTTEPNWGESTIESYLNTIASGWKSYDGRKVLSIELGGSEKLLTDILDKSVLSSDGKIELILNYSEQLQYIKYISKLYHMGKEYLFDYWTPEPESGKTFTVTFDQVSDTTQWNPVYSDDAAGLTPGSTAFDEFFGYSGVRLNGSGVETASVTQEQSGGAGNLDITKLGTLTSGDNVMIKFPLRGIKMTTSGTKITLSITSELNKEGYQYYAFTKDGDINNPGTPKSCFYIGAYLSSNDGAKSLSGASPTGDKTQSAFITAAKTNGANYNIMGFYQRQYINALYMMKYGNPDSQTVIGKGYTNSSNTAAKATGGTNTSTNASYGTTSDTVQSKLFGIEDWWGNMYQWCGGAYTDANKILYSNLWNYDGTVSGGMSTGKTIQNTSGNCITTVSGDNKAMFMPTATVSNSNYNTYRSDYAYVSASCLARVGGRWDDGSYAGAFYVCVDCSASSSRSGIGSRLCYLG